MDSPPPAILGKCLMPVPAGRPAVNKVLGLACGTREQVSVSHGHTGTTDVLLSKPTNGKVNSKLTVSA